MGISNLGNGWASRHPGSYGGAGSPLPPASLRRGDKVVAEIRHHREHVASSPVAADLPVGRSDRRSTDPTSRVCLRRGDKVVAEIRHHREHVASSPVAADLLVGRSDRRSTDPTSKAGDHDDASPRHKVRSIEA